MSSSSSLSSRPDWDRLLSACQKNLPDEVRRLIVQRGVSPSHANRMQQSALHVAALWAHVECVRVLLEEKANVHAKNKLTGATPLHIAVQCSKGTKQNRIRTVQLLLEAGANPCLGDDYGSVPADYCDDDQLLQLIAPGVPDVFSAKTVQELIKLLEKDETAVHARYRGMTPLMQVVEDLVECDGDDQSEEATRLLRSMEELLKRGADPNATRTVQRNGHFTSQDDDSSDSFCLGKVLLKLKNAYRWHNPDIIDRFESAAKLLYQHGAAQPEPSLLLDAARRNQVRFAEFLLGEMQLSPNTKGRQGMTPLQFAARSGQVEMVVLLLHQKGIDVNATDDRGQSALDAARSNDKQAVIALLEEHDVVIQRKESTITDTTPSV